MGDGRARDMRWLYGPVYCGFTRGSGALSLAVGSRAMDAHGRVRVQWVGARFVRMRCLCMRRMHVRRLRALTLDFQILNVRGIDCSRILLKGSPAMNALSIVLKTELRARNVIFSADRQ